MLELLQKLQGGLIVSCQASEESPLRDVRIMAALARAAQNGGAVGIRANGPADIAAIRAVVNLPIIGINKLHLPGYEVYITPTLDSAREVVQAGCDLLALDATLRPHPADLSTAEIIQACRLEFKMPVMADISTLEEGLAAADAGADIVATTLTGYTSYTSDRPLPDFELLEKLVTRLSIPVFVEGHIRSPADARRALELGAFAVVVGAAITRPEWITANFVQNLINLRNSLS
jgi:N-acylglucosamine-6-phosphate 2-epimerase